MQLAPDGKILSVRMVSPSGLSGWDEAAERGIRRAEQLPCQANGVCPPELLINLRPRDLN